MPDIGLEKEAMRRFWTARGPAWDRWADVVAVTAPRLNEPLITAALVKSGQKILDLASGAGEPALTISERIGPAGEVVASDLVTEMLEGARRRAKARGLANLRFEFADMEALPFPERSFDRVTCRFGIMFVPNARRALEEAQRVLVPGGRAAFMVWGPREDTTMFRIIVAAADRILGHDPQHDMSVIFRFAEPGSLASLFDRAGFVDVKEEDLHLSGSMPLGEPFWRPQVEMSLGTRLTNATAQKQRALEVAVEEAFAGEIQDGRYVLAAHARIVTGSAP
ncbi:MAG TPA: class I SAM-dependent methyltransferase [Alphaproteobacteria bacterium]|nr:class I SAM-dependent methyltransferase [Alphaproteobacteria bacterium]